MCFRILETLRWTTGSPQMLRDLMALDAPPYASILLAHLPPNEAHVVVPLCEYCACFVKERSHRSEVARIMPGRKHGMQLSVEHVLSGGTRPAPSLPHFLRCLRILELPHHPFGATQQGLLRDRLLARKALHNEDCLTRWIMEGRQPVFTDARLAKLVRRWLNRRSTHQPPLNDAPDRLWHATHALPNPCRFCLRLEEAATATTAAGQMSPPSFSGVLLLGSGTLHALETALLEMEETLRNTHPHGLVFTCIKCRRPSTVSFAYHQAVWPQLGLAAAKQPDIYYGWVIAIARAMEKKKDPSPKREVETPLEFDLSLSDNNNNDDDEDNDDA
jgi:hypothetical protein